jgi:hypothetical protein
MIIDGHGHAFPYGGGEGMYESAEEHLRNLH